MNLVIAYLGFRLVLSYFFSFVLLGEVKCVGRSLVSENCKGENEPPRTNILVVIEHCPTDRIQINQKFSEWMLQLVETQTDQGAKIFFVENGSSYDSERQKIQKSMTKATLEEWNLKDLKEKELKTIKLIIALGSNEATLLAASLFQGTCLPPIIPDNVANKCIYLSPYKITHKEVYQNEKVIHRSRLVCNIIKKENMEHLADPIDEKYFAMNDVVIHKGPNGPAYKLDLFVDEKFCTTVVGGGLVISTPTGTTSNALSSGGTFIHPSVNAIIISPYLSNSISFRPIILPPYVVITVIIVKGFGDKATMTVEVDDTDIQAEFKQDQQLVVRMAASDYSVPTIIPEEPTKFWLHTIQEEFSWNKKRGVRNNAEDSKDKSSKLSNAHD